MPGLADFIITRTYQDISTSLQSETLYVGAGYTFICFKKTAIGSSGTVTLFDQSGQSITLNAGKTDTVKEMFEGGESGRYIMAKASEGSMGVSFTGMYYDSNMVPVIIDNDDVEGSSGSESSFSSSTQVMSTLSISMQNAQATGMYLPDDANGTYKNMIDSSIRSNVDNVWYCTNASGTWLLYRVKTSSTWHLLKSNQSTAEVWNIGQTDKISEQQSYASVMELQNASMAWNSYEWMSSSIAITLV